MQKFACAIALVVANVEATQRLSASSLCIDNWTSVDVNWILMDEFFIEVGNWAPTTASGTTVCQDITALDNNVTEGMNLNPFAKDVPEDVTPTYVEVSPAEPFLTYQADGPQVTYFCGVDTIGRGICCCASG